MDAQASSLQEMPLGTPFRVPFSSKCIGEVGLGQAKLAYKLKLRLRAEGAFLSESVTSTCCADTHLSKTSWPSLPPSTQETAEMSTLV